MHVQNRNIEYNKHFTKMYTQPHSLNVQLLLSKTQNVIFLFGIIYTNMGCLKSNPTATQDEGINTSGINLAQETLKFCKNNGRRYVSIITPDYKDGYNGSDTQQNLLKSFFIETKKEEYNGFYLTVFCPFLMQTPASI